MLPLLPAVDAVITDPPFGLTEQGITEGDAGFAVANKLAEKTKLAKKGEVKVKATKAPKSAKKDVTAEELVEAAKV